MNLHKDQTSIRFEKTFAVSLFVILWTYLIIRAFTVFFIHDEIVTKWSFIVDWNPFPAQGYVDANNHFLLSLIGGLLVRLFNSDAIIVTRMAGLLAFPIYFWSIYGLRNLFERKINFYGLLIGLTCTAFIVEYFALARGYGLSFAFLVLALQQTTRYFQSKRFVPLIGLLLAWLFAVYANLTLIPFAIAGVLIVLIFTWSRGSRILIIPILCAFAPLGYLINYSFELKELGKLYYGGSEGFFSTTIHTITPFLWNAEHILIDGFLVIATLLIAFVMIKQYWKSKNLFDPRTLFPLFFLLGIGNIVGQHWLLDINYPSDRTALYLHVFFLGALFFTLDTVQWKQRWFSSLYIIGTVAFFVIHFNFSHSILHYGEHIDRKMVELIPEEVNGTPPTTGGRWTMENEMNRTLGLPLRMFQEVRPEVDTLVDYLVYSHGRWPDINKWYRTVYTDEISGQSLFERKHFLKRTKFSESQVKLQGSNEFQVLNEADLSAPLLFRCSGDLQNMDRYQDVFVVFTSKDTVTGVAHTYDALSFMQNARESSSGTIQFDFSYAMKVMPDANQFAVYIWNKKSVDLRGEIKLEVYTLAD